MNIIGAVKLLDCGKADYITCDALAKHNLKIALPDEYFSETGEIPLMVTNEDLILDIWQPEIIDILDNTWRAVE